VAIRYEVREGIAYFTIDNGKMNPFTPQMHKDFYHQLKAFDIDGSAKVGIISGAPGKPFSVGDDLKNRHAETRTPQQELEAYLFLHRNEDETPSRPGWDIDVLHHRRTKPIVAAIDGYCLGKGLIYTLIHSDIRIASTEARFGLPEINYGMAGASGSTRLARHLATVDAAWLALTGEIIDAAEADRIRLVNRVVPRERLMAEAERAARMIARHPEIAIRVEMETLGYGLDLGRNEAVTQTQNLYRLQRMGYGGPGSDPTTILGGLKAAKAREA
jgi:enoyl-CoA hydratase/carnithine racemase